jgi:aminoglycoside phosphotransferase family enzyme/predicted kinase
MRRDLSQEEGTDPALLDALTAPAIYGESLPVAVHETHASWVFLAGELAYKVKKPVRLAFLDYSTLSLRHAACLEEVRVNQELAPGIYLGVRAILRTAEWFRFAAQDTPGAVEYAVLMRRFDEAHTLQGAIHTRSLTHAQIREVARRLAAFHLGSPALTASGAAQVLDAWSANVEEIECLEHPGEWHVEVMRGFGEAFIHTHASEIERRVGEGWVRDGHGDLRCEHVLLGPPVRVVDRIEFDPALRHLDVACDLAFLAMDLEAHGRRWAARELVNAYRRAGGSPGSEQFRGFHCAYWALVRAKVALIAAASREAGAHQGDWARAERLWRLAERLCWRARGPVAIVVCGAAASGKSTLAAELARRSRFPVVSSDSIRKRRAGLRATDRASAEHYTKQFTRATYDLLSRDALEHLDRRGGVIVDATCHTKSERALLFHRLCRGNVTFLVVHCQVSLQTALDRAAARMQSPERISDATPQIVTEQFRRFQPLDELPAQSVLALDGEQDIDVQVAGVTRASDERMRAARQTGHGHGLKARAFPRSTGAFTR